MYFFSEVYLVLQGYDWIIFGSVDVKNVVFIFCIQVIGNVGKRGVCSFGDFVVNDYYVFFFI